MSDASSDLAVKQLDRMLDPWRRPELAQRPHKGWLRAIRSALGMTTVALSQRLGITPAGVRKLEAAEADGRISMQALERAAAALGCEVRYALVPRDKLEKTLLNRAREVAEKQLRSVHQTMLLEDQAISRSARSEQAELLAKRLLHGTKRDLWR